MFISGRGNTFLEAERDLIRNFKIATGWDSMIKKCNDDKWWLFIIDIQRKLCIRKDYSQDWLGTTQILRVELLREQGYKCCSIV